MYKNPKIIKRDLKPIGYKDCFNNCFTSNCKFIKKKNIIKKTLCLKSCKDQCS